MKLFFPDKEIWLQIRKMKFTELQTLLKKYDKKICDSVSLSNIYKNMEIAALIEKRIRIWNKMKGIKNA